ncbi:MAG TPA: hypothetical protein VFK85_05045 [Anaeromyxobacteraceae bacterium]|nr:hypothetical protein [Anaeromyxobacteraceae bacterium]
MRSRDDADSPEISTPRDARSWNPGQGAGVAEQQVPPAPAVVRSDGSVDRMLWTPTEGPCRTEVGGAGGEPDGTSVPIRKVSWD